LLHLFLVLGLFAQLAIAESPATCEEKGFASSLLCSSCDKLSAFVGDSEMVRECRDCCLDDSVTNNRKVKKALLQIHPFMVGRFSEISNFLDKNSKRYSNLVIDTHASVSAPRLRIYYEDGKKEVVQISSWKENQLLEFCDSILERNP
ncbi:hypothetical protein WA556_003380, partial [Blastocystis sp. ATCC 50177/Nand II]